MSALRNSLLLLGLLLLAACSVPDWLGDGEKPKLAGERIAVLARADGLKPDPSLAGTPVGLPSAQANDQWPQHMFSARSVPGHVALSGSLTQKQEVTVGEGEAWPSTLVASPIVSGDYVFAMDALGNIAAHEAANIGHIYWTSKGVSDEDDTPILGGGLALDNGMLFATSGLGAVVALDAATGEQKWRQKLNIPMRAPPKVDGGQVYVVTIDSQTFALDAATGAIKWSHRGIDETAGFLSTVSPAAMSAAVVAPYVSGEIYALRPRDGAEGWSDSLITSRRTSASSVFSGVGADPVMEDEALYVVGGGGVLAAFHLPTGRRVWEQPIAAHQTPWLVGDALFVLSSDAQLVALSRVDGRVYWVQQLPRFEDEEKHAGPYLWSGPVVASGRVFVVGAHGTMVSFAAADGGDAQSMDIPDGVTAAPVIAGGRMFLVTQSSKLISLQ